MRLSSCFFVVMFVIADLGCCVVGKLGFGGMEFKLDIFRVKDGMATLHPASINEQIMVLDIRVNRVERKYAPYSSQQKRSHNFILF